jgi:hypothetical protein
MTSPQIWAAEMTSGVPEKKRFTPSNPSAMGRYRNAMWRKIGVRQFVVTTNGYMPLVPPGTKEGNYIAVFLGVATPHV